MAYAPIRIFSGHGYDLHLMHTAKRSALRDADGLRKKGYNVRVIHMPLDRHYPYATYKNRRRG